MIYLTQYLIAFTAIVIVPLYYYFTKLRKIINYCENFPTPPGKFFLNNAQDFKSAETFLPTLHRYKKEYGDVVHMRLGPIGHSLLVSDPKFLEFLLTNTKIVNRASNIRYLSPWIGDGLVTAEGNARWKIHRKLITPAFHFKILEQFVEVFEANGVKLVEKLSKLSGSKSVDIFPLISLYALDVICETAMGIKIDAQNNQAIEYFKHAKEMAKRFTTRTINLIKRYDLTYKLTKDYQIEKEACKFLHEYSSRVIRRKQNELKNKMKVDEKEDEDDVGIKKKKVFLDVLLEATVDGEPLSFQEIREEVDTFMFAGHDTTATATSYVLFCLAHNKDIQEKVYQEQKQLFGDDLKNLTVTYANLQEMKYLENVVKEALRLYSPVPAFGRQITEDVEYEGKVIPKGLIVLTFGHGVHMNPKYYPNPEKFDPSRFEDTQGRPTFAYIPFGAGARNCIGQKYAMLEIKSSVGRIVRNFELFPAQPEHKLQLSAETVLNSLNGVKIGLKLR